MNIGQRVKHEKYGLGTIVTVLSRGKSLNVGVKFDKGGPMGFANNATHDVKSLKAVK